MRLSAEDLTQIAAGVSAVEEALHGQFTVRRADIVLEFTPGGRDLPGVVGHSSGVQVVLGYVAGAVTIIAVDEATTGRN